MSKQGLYHVSKWFRFVPLVGLAWAMWYIIVHGIYCSSKSTEGRQPRGGNIPYQLLPGP